MRFAGWLFWRLALSALLSEFQIFTIMNDSLVIAQYEKIQGHDKWFKEMPSINFPSKWAVKITPPSAGAIVRFRVYSGKAEVSVYLDCYDRLGYFGAPYWEVYPHSEDVFRCEMNDTESLLKAIEESIREQNEG